MSTDVAGLPEGWTKRALADVGLVVTGSTPPTEDRTNYGTAYMFASPFDLGRAKYVEITFKRLSAKGFERSRKVPKDSTLFVCIGSTIGKVGIAGNVLATNQQINSGIPGPDVNAEFLYYASLTLSAIVREQAGEQAVPLVSKSAFSKFEILLPPRDEQCQIANVLGNVDSLIASLERLIAKKRAIKQGMMQRLLTGRTRLPGYQEPWADTPLRNFLPMQRGFDLPTSKIIPGPYPVVYSNGVARHHARAMVRGPGVVTGRSGTIGAVHFVEKDYWPHNTSLWVTSFARVEARFAYYFLTHLGLDRFASGSGVPTFNRNDAHSYLITLPTSREEQEAIAQVLVDVDDEIDALQRRHEATRAIKLGMMQELLTGRTRLPVESVP